MNSQRVPRRIESLLDEAEEAIAREDWPLVAARARAVLSLDEQNSDARSYLKAAEKNLVDRSDLHIAEIPAAAAAAPNPTAPTSFASGRYEVLRFLGEGGKKKVYLANDSLLDRDVAFALIKTEGLDEASRTRVSREAQAMGRLGAHPHIVTVFDLGESDGQPFMVTELMGGGDVEGLIEQAPEHRVPMDQALRIASEVCAGLEFAHSRGIVHRDLKPGNVWLTSEGIAKIGDFGLAVSLDRSRLTQAGMMVGTVSYMPPEQATGGDVTARSDLYSVGAMLYELICGRPPFVGDENVAIIGQHLNTPPVAPSWHRRNLPQGLETLILRLLAKDPTQRPASASEVRRAIESIDLDSSPQPSAEGQASAEDPVYRQTFVGRETELKQLQSAFDGALSGHGALAMVIGEPGIGKTALCEQLATYAAIRGGRVLRGNCYEEGSLSLPYLAFIEALRTYVLARDPEALRSELGSNAGYVARIVSEVRDRVQVELPDPGDPEDDRWRLLQSVTAFLRRASEVQPLLLLLEDLHWSDRGTLDLLQHLARNLQGARVLVVGTYRDVEVDRTHPLSNALAELRRIGSFSSVRLRGLSAEDVHTMLERIAQRQVPWAVAEQVHRQTEGHPLFVQEVMRYLVEEGVLARDEGGRLQRQGETPMVMQIPEGLRDVIGKRISRLSADCNRVLSVAAVISRDFAFDTLTAVARLPDESILAALEEAVRIGVLQEQTSGSAVRYRFAHAFFRQTLYEEQIAPRRLRLHQEVARALEVQHARRLDDHAAELAEHFSYSTDPADLAKAVQYAERAAERALAVFDYGEACRLLEKALGVQDVLDPDDRTRRCELLLDLGESLMPAGEPQRASAEVAEEAFRLAEDLEDHEAVSRACRLGITGLQRFGAASASGTPAFRTWAERLDAYAQPETADRALADSALASVLRSSGRRREAWPVFLKAVDLARSVGQPEDLFRVAAGVLGQHSAPEHENERRRLAHEVLTWPRDGVNTYNLAATVAFAGMTLLGWGEREQTEALWDQVRAIAERTRDPSPGLRSLFYEGLNHVLAGEFEAALAVGRRLVTRGDEVGQPVAARGYAVLATHRPLAWMGRADEALKADVAGFRVGTRAVLLAHSGDLLGARTALEHDMQDDVEGAAGDDPPTDILLFLLEAAVVTGQQRTAADLFARLLPVSGMSFCRFTCPARHLGAAAALLGRAEEARLYYLQALDVAGQIRFRPEIALTHLQLAELLVEHYPAERAEAQEHLDFALEEFREMKMQPSLQRALGHKGLLKA